MSHGLRRAQSAPLTIVRLRRFAVWCGLLQVVHADGRRALVVQLYEAGATYEQIGRQLGVTRERAGQLLDQYGVEMRPRSERLYEAAFPERAQEVETLFLQLRDDAAVSAQTNIDERSVRTYVDANIPDPAVLRRRRKRNSEHYSDEEMIACLQTAAMELGTPIAHARYAEWTRGRILDEARPWPGPQGMMLRFGGWRSALARAGLPANPTAGPDPRFELSDAVDAMVQAWRDIGEPPTVAGYEIWRASRQDVPSSATARKFVAGWDDLRLAAWPIVHGRRLPGVGSHDQPAEAETIAAIGPGGPYRRAEENPQISMGAPFERDPQELERSLGSHSALQNKLADGAMARGYEPLSPRPLDPEFDVACRAWRSS